jgi:hypothetical protein
VKSAQHGGRFLIHGVSEVGNLPQVYANRVCKSRAVFFEHIAKSTSREKQAAEFKRAPACSGLIC